MKEINTFEELDEIFERIERRSNQLRPYWNKVRTDNTGWEELGREIILLEESVGEELQDAVYDELLPCLESEQMRDWSDPLLSECVEWNAWRDYRAAFIRLAKSCYITSISYRLADRGTI